MQGKLSIYESEPFTLLLKAQRGNGPKGDIAVDDVWMDNNVCNSNPNVVRNAAMKTGRVNCF